jgi:hypothetical protein
LIFHSNSMQLMMKEKREPVRVGESLGLVRTPKKLSQ